MTEDWFLYARQHTSSSERLLKPAVAGPTCAGTAWVSVALTNAGGVDLRLKTKLESMYGEATRKLIRECLPRWACGMQPWRLRTPARLPFVLTARVEAAARRLGLDVGAGCLPECSHTRGIRQSATDSRRSRLYLPGNESKFMINAGLHQPDGVILDLEDSVALSVKDEARLIVRNAAAHDRFPRLRAHGSDQPGAARP